MAEGFIKVLWFVVSGVFIFGAWSATLELRTQDHTTRITSLEEKWDKNQEKIIDNLTHINERLQGMDDRPTIKRRK